MSSTDFGPLVETAWLEAHLADADLRIFDCTMNYSASGGKLQFDSGREAWATAHIPGSDFIDILEELSDHDSPLTLQMAVASQCAAAMSRHGVGEGTRVVLYDTAMTMWATRVWWMLRTMGFDTAAVLNGGWHKWSTEERPVSTDAPTYPPAQFVARPRPALMADQQVVKAAIADGKSCVVSALPPELYAGSDAMDITRRGHIASSVNVPFNELFDPETQAFLPVDQLREKFKSAGATGATPVITYCGTGIAATSDAFVLTLLGHEQVAVYDGSLEDWSADPNLPMQTGN